jgi:hypothetical protein
MISGNEMVDKNGEEMVGKENAIQIIPTHP